MWCKNYFAERSQKQSFTIIFEGILITPRPLFTFNVIFVDSDKIRELNKTYRNIDRETDVISFALEDGEANINFEFGRLLGDIYICVPKMKAQAKEYGHSIAREMGFLTVHGLLHLLGYDHMTKEEEKIMFAKQEEILNAYGLKR